MKILLTGGLIIHSHLVHQDHAAVLAGACLNAVFAGDGQLEGEHLVALTGLHQLAVLIQRDLRQIGVDLDLGHILGAVYIAAAAQVHERLLAPVGLVEIEGVFFELAVKRF